jgi:hypothetical protein
MVTNSSAAVGWTPMVESKSALVAPACARGGGGLRQITHSSVYAWSRLRKEGGGGGALVAPACGGGRGQRPRKGALRASA